MKITSKDLKTFRNSLASQLNDMKFSKKKVYGSIILYMIDEQYYKPNVKALRYLESLEDPLGFLIEVSKISEPDYIKSAYKKVLGYNIRTALKSATEDPE